MLRQGDTGDWIGTFEGHKGAVWGVALNADATRAASGAADFTGKVWDAISGEELHSFQHNHIVKSVNFSKDSSLLTTGSNEKLVRVFDLNKPEAGCPLDGVPYSCETPVYTGHTSAVRHFRSADDKTLRVWDRSSGKEVQKVDFPSTPNSLEVSKDGTVLTVTYSNHVAFLDAESLNKIREFSIPTTVNSASLHPDKSYFVTGESDLKVYKFDYTTGAEIESFKGHFGPIHCIKFSPDGELYASGSEDGTLRLWQTTVGKTYGLWKCVDGQSNNDSLSSPKEVQAN
ncbi:hypothetical protein NQ317_008855 [Molorchus minor]|uniref:Serine-threonine kinase receptor-associated protein n=1 Tax=Molorchus minor TaxID=1323400 RepID=A0ABQ9IS77_9CUCU|nr:hypothetical protein NQ317_008855 [Molorchus minor]